MKFDQNEIIPNKTDWTKDDPAPKVFAEFFGRKNSY